MSETVSMVVPAEPSSACTVTIDSNDDEGHDRGKFSAFEIAVALTDIQSTVFLLEGEDVAIEYHPNAIAVEGTSYPIAPHSRHRHAGNLCWDEVAMPLGDACTLARRLIDRGWVVTDGTASAIERVLEEHRERGAA